MSETEIGEANISPIKKERMKKAAKQALGKKLRDDLPVLTMKEIRKFRMPFHESLLLDLEESEYVNTFEFVKQLLDYQEKLKKKAGPGTLIWQRPLLVSSKENLSWLSDSLIKAEQAHQEQNYVLEWDCMLQLAAYYAFGIEDWWWLGEQLLYQCISMQYPGDFEKQITISHYLMGKYLVENGKKLESGKFHLERSREMSLGKSWNCSKFLNQQQDTIFMESCHILHETLVEEATVLLYVDPTKAIEIATVARKRATEACNFEGEFKAFLLKGRCELQLKRCLEAVATVTKALTRSMRRNYMEGVCEATITLALAYLQCGRPEKSLECLNDLKILAEEQDMPFYVAQAYRYMGEYYLNQKYPSKATPLLMMAFYIFHETNDLPRQEKVRNWAAISAGEELFPAFIGLIQSCDNTPEGHVNLLKLIKWIDNKESFWSEESQLAFSCPSMSFFRSQFDKEKDKEEGEEGEGEGEEGGEEGEGGEGGEEGEEAAEEEGEEEEGEEQREEGEVATEQQEEDQKEKREEYKIEEQEVKVEETEEERGVDKNNEESREREIGESIYTIKEEEREVKLEIEDREETRQEIKEEEREEEMQ